MSRYILDTRLSDDHYVICTEAIRLGIIDADDLNEGRRTMGEQWHFYNNQPPLAAFPRPGAPHIWWGKNNHAIDANSYNGAARALARYYTMLGVHVVFNVPGENWHFQPTSGSQLKAAADKIRRQRDLLVSKVGERERRVQFFKHQLHYLRDPRTKRPYFAAGGKPDHGWTSLFTEELEEAVRRFQRVHKLRADGVIGPKTDRAIDRAYSKAKRQRKAAKLRAQERAARVARGEDL
jgi:hypothetical protein